MISKPACNTTQNDHIGSGDVETVLNVSTTASVTVTRKLTSNLPGKAVWAFGTDNGVTAFPQFLGVTDSSGSFNWNACTGGCPVGNSSRGIYIENSTGGISQAPILCTTNSLDLHVTAAAFCSATQNDQMGSGDTTGPLTMKSAQSAASTKTILSSFPGRSVWAYGTNNGDEITPVFLGTTDASGTFTWNLAQGPVLPATTSETGFSRIPTAPRKVPWSA